MSKFFVYGTDYQECIVDFLWCAQHGRNPFGTINGESDTGS